jgi:hypothetical protein
MFVTAGRLLNLTKTSFYHFAQALDLFAQYFQHSLDSMPTLA